MKILITGVAGFIGSHTAERFLALGDEVVGLDDFNDYYEPKLKRQNIHPSLSNPNFKLIEGDIQNTELIERLFSTNQFDCVVHLAARAGVRQSFQNPVLYESTNVIGLLNLLQASATHGKPYFVFASSSSVYGISQRLPWSEDDPVDCPISPYAITKRTGELLCFSYFKNYGLRSCSLRLFTVYGPRQRPEMAVSKFFQAILAGGEVLVFGDGSARRDFTYVQDIVDGIVASTRHQSDCEILNLGGAHTISVLELIQKIEKITGKVPKIRFFPPQPGDVPSTWADTNKATRLLGAAPATSLDQGLTRFHEWLNQGAVCRPVS